MGSESQPQPALQLATRTLCYLSHIYLQLIDLVLIQFFIFHLHSIIFSHVNTGLGTVILKDEKRY